MRDDAKQLSKLSAASVPARMRKCTPETVHDGELGLDWDMCGEDKVELRAPIKSKGSRGKRSRCKEYAWSETKKGKRCVCSETGKSAPARYCTRSDAR
jgi:hypothetical protein